MVDFPEPEQYPGIVKCRGGWFAVAKPGDLGSGPWSNEKAANLALEGRWTEAHTADKRKDAD